MHLLSRCLVDCLVAPLDDFHFRCFHLQRSAASRFLCLAECSAQTVSRLAETLVLMDAPPVR